MTTIRYAHLADIHLGSFREKKLKTLHINQFIKAIDTILESNIDFVLIAGDIFNVALPPLEYIEIIIEQIQRMQQKGIQTYVIGGSHDYSLTHKSFIDILDKTNIWTNVSQYELTDTQSIQLTPTTITIKNTPIQLCGITGKKNALDNTIYSNLQNKQTNPSATNNNNNNNLPYSIFLFHTTITQLLTPNMQQLLTKQFSTTQLPQGFNYYAGGHIHIPNSITTQQEQIIAYCGPLFPNSFAEFKLKHSGFNIVEFDAQTHKQTLEYVPLELPSIHHISIDCSNQSLQECYDTITQTIHSYTQNDSTHFENAIVLFELSGELNEISSSIDTSQFVDMFYDLNAYIVLKNTTKLTTKKHNATSRHTNEFSTTQELEENIVKQIIENSTKQDNEQDTTNPLYSSDFKIELAKQLLKINPNKEEDETNYHFEERVYSEVREILNTPNKKK
ncbi:MAG: exonuclease SbcCD subunit D [Candidatus Nanoarchaeia archaeon]